MIELRSGARLLAGLTIFTLLPGCAAVGIATSTTQLVAHVFTTTADLAIGVGRVTVNAVGMGVDAVTPPSAPPAPIATVPAPAIPK